jgi:hypothetical protein
MRDIVATIQAEQNEIIRLDHPEVLVIESGPGTGKTVVALHRLILLAQVCSHRPSSAPPICGCGASCGANEDGPDLIRLPRGLGLGCRVD